MIDLALFHAFHLTPHLHHALFECLQMAVPQSQNAFSAVLSWPHTCTLSGSTHEM